jgi:hypothetical protein
MSSNQYILATRHSLIGFYREQLEKFLKLGLGKRTEFNVKITDVLIRSTRKRLVQLGGRDALKPDWGKVPKATNYSNSLSTLRVKEWRKKQKLKQLNKESK